MRYKSIFSIRHSSDGLKRSFVSSGREASANSIHDSSPVFRTAASYSLPGYNDVDPTQVHFSGSALADLFPIRDPSNLVSLITRTQKKKHF